MTPRLIPMGNEKPKRKKSVTKSHMSVDWFRENGYLCEPTEQTIRYPDREHPGKWKVFKRDAYNAFDGIAVKLDASVNGTVYFQATVGMNNKPERIKKIEASPATIPLLRSGNTIELHIWRKLGKKGARKVWALARYQAHVHGEGIAWNELIEEDDFDYPMEGNECKTADMF